MVVAPNMEHGMVGKFECRDGYMLKGNNTTQCYFGNWTGLTPWCKEGEASLVDQSERVENILFQCTAPSLAS